MVLLNLGIGRGQIALFIRREGFFQLSQPRPLLPEV
jgi:hypothetical protein